MSVIDEFRAMELHRAGSTFADIGAELNVSTADAYRLVQAALKNDQQATIDEQRAIDAGRCDALTKSLWERAITPAKGQLRYADAVLKIMKRRADLLGLDRPTKSEINMTHVGEVTPADAARIVREAFGAVTPDDASDDVPPKQPT